MKLIIVRHAQSEHNIHHLMVAKGHSRLTEKGKQQVERAAERLRSEHIDVAFSSDAVRALDTAQGILQFHPGVVLEINELLRERHMGEMEGKTREEFIADAKKSGLKWYEHRPVGGETMLETQQRGQKFFTALMPKYFGKTVLIVSHGGFIRAFLNEIMKTDYDTDAPIRLGNAAITIMEIDDQGSHKVHVMNDTSHLDPDDVAAEKAQHQ